MSQKFSSVNPDILSQIKSEGQRDIYIDPETGWQASMEQQKIQNLQHIQNAKQS